MNNRIENNAITVSITWNLSVIQYMTEKYECKTGNGNGKKENNQWRK